MKNGNIIEIIWEVLTAKDIMIFVPKDEQSRKIMEKTQKYLGRLIEKAEDQNMIEREFIDKAELKRRYEK